MSAGMLKATGRRSLIARRTARARSASAVSGDRICSNPAPEARTTAFWSMFCRFSRSFAGVSPTHNRTTGVCDRTPSASAVTQLVSAGPCVTVQNPTPPDTIAAPIAISTAPFSFAAAR